ncbi:MAG TPA: DUF2889 domain-containing protein [Acetobacteraceae bacterium]|nr:DUF2889 domain-containing protein [Acetobacteraceae bacterium]
MPLTDAAARELLHSRDIRIRGYRREDGLYDIEAQLADAKSYGFVNQDRGYVDAGEKLHGMWLRLTLDETMTIVASEAATDYAPYAVCPSAAPAFAGLAGLRIKPGFLREATQRVGGPAGCTHLRELLQQMATTAFQTISPYRAWREAHERGEAEEPGSDRLDARIAQKLLRGGATIVDSCRAYASDGPIVRRRWPDLYTGNLGREAGEAGAQSAEGEGEGEQVAPPHPCPRGFAP